MAQEETAMEAAKRKIALEDYAIYSSEISDRLKYQVDFAQAALKNLQFVNAGGIIALLTLLGNSKIPFDERAIWWSFFWFGVGLIASLTSYFGAFYSQPFFMNATARQAWNSQAEAYGQEGTYDSEKDMKAGNVAMIAALVVALSSLVFFMVGAFVALGGLL